MAESVVKLTKRCAKTCQHEEVQDAGCNLQMGRVPELLTLPVLASGRGQGLLCFTNAAGNAEGFVLTKVTLKQSAIFVI